MPQNSVYIIRMVHTTVKTILFLNQVKGTVNGISSDFIFINVTRPIHNGTLKSFDWSRMHELQKNVSNLSLGYLER